MRKISSLLAIWAVMIMAMPTFANTRLQDDLITIGKPGSTANKRIKLGSQEIRSNTATSKLEYTHDGVTYKPIGSGSGAGGSSGGINLIANESFEDPITTGWSNTGGTFTQESYLNGTETDAKFARFVATAAGQYFETPLITVPTNFSGGCQADFKKISVSADDLFKLEILDSSSNVLASSNIKKSSWVNFPTIDTPCPTPGSQFRLRVTSLAAGTIDSDYGYLGSNQNLVSVAQAKFFGGIKYSKTAGCSWSTTSTTYATFAAQAACPTPTVTGSASAPGTKIPGITFATMPAGQYFFILKARLGQNTAGSAATGQYRFYDGVTDYDEQAGGASQLGGATTTTFTLNSLSQNISYASTQTNVTVQLKGLTTNAANATIVDSATFSDFSIDVYYFPSSSEVAVSNEQSSWFIDANIGGANVGLGTGAQTSYVELQSVNLDLVINSSKGSASAEIACQSGVASSGLNCGGSAESFGIAFTPPWAGLFEVCTSFTQSQADGQDIVYQLAETSNTSSVIIQEGGARQAGNGSTGLQYPFYNCGTFNFSDTSKKTIRLMFEKTATTANPQLIADRSATSGQRDMKWTVRPLLSAYNRPILTGDQVTTPGAVKPVQYSAFIPTSTGTPANEKGDFINGSCSLVSAGLWSCPLSKTHLTKLNCVCNAAESSSAAGLTCNYDYPNSTPSIVRYWTATGGTLSGRDITIKCDGEIP